MFTRSADPLRGSSLPESLVALLGELVGQLEVR